MPKKNKTRYDTPDLQEDSSLERQINSNVNIPVSIDKFDSTLESWECFVERLENYFDILSITTNEAKKSQILIHNMGVQLFQEVSDYVSPEKPRSFSYENLIKIVEKIVNPRPSKIMEQHNFCLRKQKEGEGVRQYFVELKKAAKYCGFSCSKCKASTQETHIRQQFISGLSNSRIMQKLLQEHDDLELKKCVEIAESMEKSEREASNLQGGDAVQLLKAEKETGKFKCYRCGSDKHIANVCKHKGSICDLCKKVGHLKRVCRSKQNLLTVENCTNDETEDVNHITNLPEVTKRPKKYLVSCMIDNYPITFEYDTGAAVTTMSLETFKKIHPNPNLNPTTLRLSTYTGELIQVVGYTTVDIEFENQRAQGNVYLVKNNVRPIFGREWMSLIKVQLSKDNIFQMNTKGEYVKGLVHDLEHEFPKLFADDLGKIPNFKGQIKLRENAKPIFKQARPLPYAIKEKVEKEIDKLERDGVISKVSFSQWGTPVVPIMKPGGQVRLCADYKISVNKVTEDEFFPIPRQEDIFTKLSGGKVFTTLDIKKAYLHIEMNDESSNIQSITTTKGVYKVNRLMFGVKSAPAIWQRVITEILEGIPGTAVFYDDIIIQGSNVQEHLERVKQVMERLQGTI